LSSLFKLIMLCGNTVLYQDLSLFTGKIYLFTCPQFSIVQDKYDLWNRGGERVVVQKKIIWHFCYSQMITFYSKYFGCYSEYTTHCSSYHAKQDWNCTSLPSYSASDFDCSNIVVSSVVSAYPLPLRDKEITIFK
jgi:hypothetical protein